MKNIVTTGQMQRMDRLAIEHYGIPGAVLMENAGRHTAYAIMRRFSLKKYPRVTVLCGKGNNGGDGFVIARVLDAAGYDVQVFLAGKSEDISGDARLHANILIKSGIPVETVTDTTSLPENSDLYIDALLGTGVRGAARGLYETLIAWLNARTAPCVSVDIPSGLNGDSALIPGESVRAAATYTMARLKPAHLFMPAADLCGHVEIMDIGFPGTMQRISMQDALLIEKSDLRLPGRARDMYKNRAGKLLIVGGSPGLTGALTLAAKAATISGAGLVKVAIPAALNPILESILTEQMTIPVGAPGNQHWKKDQADALVKHIEWADAVVIGPGMGRSTQCGGFFNALLSYVLKMNKKCVIDADGLYWLSRQHERLKKLNEHCILTPHYGEFTRLFKDAALHLSEAPWEACYRATQYTPAVINLKGAPSVVGQMERPLCVNSTGNPVLAQGGSGDILSGICGALLSSGTAGFETAWLANGLLGDAGDRAARKKGVYAAEQQDILQALKNAVYKAEKRGRKHVDH
ncbi:MAG: NAD(P)H-hydrate dehydratase [Calditrichaeota bacterium]|nr:MAG: NAD(P)H-hydrate dehydratase [Calditrichota bacterium]